MKNLFFLYDLMTKNHMINQENITSIVQEETAQLLILSVYWILHSIQQADWEVKRQYAAKSKVHFVFERED